jgi:hypothetical protein
MPTEVKLRRLAGNDAINRRIHQMLACLHADDVEPFVRKFSQQSDEQNFHTYRELLLGSYLRQAGWNVRYERAIGGTTPDWVRVDDGGVPAEIIEVVTLHQRRTVDRAIGAAVAAGQPWVGWISTPPEHLYSKIQAKAQAYRAVATESSLAYVVAVFGEFTAPIEPFEVDHVLNDLHGGLFSEVPALSGVIFFRERFGNYEFHGFANPVALARSEVL